MRAARGLRSAPPASGHGAARRGCARARPGPRPTAPQPRPRSSSRPPRSPRRSSHPPRPPPDRAPLSPPARGSRRHRAGSARSTLSPPRCGRAGSRPLGAGCPRAAAARRFPRSRSRRMLLHASVAPGPLQVCRRGRSAWRQPCPEGGSRQPRWDIHPDEAGRDEADWDLVVRDQAATQRHRHRLGPGAGAELGLGVADVGLHRRRRELELARRSGRRCRRRRASPRIWRSRAVGPRAAPRRASRAVRRDRGRRPASPHARREQHQVAARQDWRR